MKTIIVMKSGFESVCEQIHKMDYLTYFSVTHLSDSVATELVMNQCLKNGWGFELKKDNTLRISVKTEDIKTFVCVRI